MIALFDIYECTRTELFAILIQSTVSVNIYKIMIKYHIINGAKKVQSTQSGTMHTKSNRIGTVECKKYQFLTKLHKYSAYLGLWTLTKPGLQGNYS